MNTNNKTNSSNLKSPLIRLNLFRFPDSIDVSFSYVYAGVSPSAHAGQHPRTGYVYTCKGSSPHRTPNGHHHDMVAIELRRATPNYTTCLNCGRCCVSSLDAGSKTRLSYPIADFISSLLRKKHQDGLEKLRILLEFKTAVATDVDESRHGGLHHDDSPLYRWRLDACSTY